MGRGVRRRAIAWPLLLLATAACGRIGFDDASARLGLDGRGNGDGLTGDGTGGGSVGAVHVYAGFNHTCVIIGGGAVRCWGMGTFGQLGYGNTASIGDDELPSVAGDVPLGGVAVQLAVGGEHTCARLDSGAVRCWGRNSYGQLGYGNLNQIGDDETPASAGDVPLGAAALQITAGANHTCALIAGGSVRCWGQGSAGALGLGTPSDIGDNEPASAAGLVPVGGTVVEIEAGGLHTCARLDTGAIRCWGFNLRGQLGYGNTNDIGDDEPASAAGNVPLGGTAVDVDAGYDHTCARMATGMTRCWGRGDFGQLGYGNTTWIGDTEPASAAGDLPLGGDAVEIAAGFWHSCARLGMGQLRCWGAAFVGTLGYGNQMDIGDDEPASAAGDVPLGGVATEISGNADHMCALIAPDGRVRCWGQGNYGKLGYGNSNFVGDDEPASAAGFVQF